MRRSLIPAAAWQRAARRRAAHPGRRSSLSLTGTAAFGCRGPPHCQPSGTGRRRLGVGWLVFGTAGRHWAKRHRRTCGITCRHDAFTRVLIRHSLSPITEGAGTVGRHAAVWIIRDLALWRRADALTGRTLFRLDVITQSAIETCRFVLISFSLVGASSSSRIVNRCCFGGGAPAAASISVVSCACCRWPLDKMHQRYAHKLQKHARVC